MEHSLMLRVKHYLDSIGILYRVRYLEADPTMPFELRRNPLRAIELTVKPGFWTRVVYLELCRMAAEKGCDVHVLQCLYTIENKIRVSFPLKPKKVLVPA